MMTAPEWTHLVIFNPQLKHDRQSKPVDPTLDKEDWDEAAQVLFAEGKGWINAEGKKEWNAILKQMGLAKGLMGFMSMVETQSFPESTEDEDTFQIIHSKRRVTCIYQVEPDYCIVAVYMLPLPITQNVAANASSSRHKQESSPPKQDVVTDEQYKAALTKACGRYLLTNGSLSSRMESKGRDHVAANLGVFWSSWMKKHPRISVHQQNPSSGGPSEVDQACCDVWQRLIKGNTDEGEEKECVLMAHGEVLLSSGSVMAEPSLVDYLQDNLHISSPPSSKEMLMNDALQSGAKNDKHGHQHGTWKKLGLGSWGSAVGLGSAGERPTTDSKKHGNHQAIKGKSEESAASSGVSWAGIGQWFGISSSASDAATSGTASPSTKESSSDTKRKDIDRPEIDLASLHSALDSELGELEEQDASSREEPISWAQEQLWSKAGTVAITVHSTINRNAIFAYAIHGHDADADSSPRVEPALLQALFSSRTVQILNLPRFRPTTQFTDSNDPTEEVKYHNPLQLEIRDTPKAGRGVFAPSDIPAGTILEESPILILTRTEWDEGKLDDGVLGGYAFNWSNGGMAIGLGIACMFNHSPKPNVNFIRRAPTAKKPNIEPAIVFMTSRRIEKGEELYICYGQESKLWFSPDYGKTTSQKDSIDQEIEVEDAETFLSGFDGLVEPTESQDEEITFGTEEHRETEVKLATAESAPRPLGGSPRKLVNEVEAEEQVTDMIMLDGMAENEDEARRDRKREKKALQNEKAAKYQQKKAARAAASKGHAVESIELAPPLLVSPTVDDAIMTTSDLDYQEALRKLNLVHGIEVSSDDIKAIEEEEGGQPDFEGAHGFAGWRRVRRVPGLSLSGEAPLDSTLQVWAVEVPSQMIGKLTQYIRHRKLVEDELAHLKRIYKDLSTGTTLIALYLTSKMSEEDVRSDLKEYDPALSDMRVAERAVPARAAHSMKEVEILKPLWPVALRQRPILAADLPWSASRKAWVKNGIIEVVKLAKRQKTTGEHCVAVFATSAPKAAQLHDPDAIPPTPDIRAVGLDTRKAAGHPLRHATISCVTEIANLRTMSPFADVLATRNGAGYLLTSLSVFMTHEPCIMCAMALVHSRVKEVFYLTTTGGSSNGGGFGGSYPVHSHPGLNHQMDLFDCSELVSADDVKELIITEKIDI